MGSFAGFVRLQCCAGLGIAEHSKYVLHMFTTILISETLHQYVCSLHRTFTIVLLEISETGRCRACSMQLGRTRAVEVVNIVTMFPRSLCHSEELLEIENLSSVIGISSPSRLDLPFEEWFLNALAILSSNDQLRLVLL
jgi:hypothetical protein